MKKLFTFIFCLVSFYVHGQWGLITFDPLSHPDYNTFITIDTNYHRNIWQVGKPSKTVFDSAYSVPNAIVTDTLNPYSVKDTSVFTLKMPGFYPDGPTYFTDLSFYYQLNIDSGATAKVELSEDSGVHWTNIIEYLPTFYSWTGMGAPVDTPNLKVSTTGWKQFFLSREPFYVADTILVRFTFISDSTPSVKDGWIIDNMSLDYYYYANVAQLQNNNLISLYPNPSKGNIYIHSEKQYPEEPTIIVYNTKGQEVYKTDKLPPTGYLDLPLPDGIYTLKYATKEEYCVKRIVIVR